MSPLQRSVRALALLWAAHAALAPPQARACAACGCGDPTLTSMGVEKPFKNRVRLSLEELFGGHQQSADFPRQTWTLRSTLTGSWSPLPWLTVAAALPWVDNWVRDFNQTRYDGIHGLGDLELMARALVWRDRGFSPRHMLGLLAGLKTPTGPLIRDDKGYPYADDDQPGSGSWDPFAGASYAWFGNLTSVFASASYRYTTAGYHGYRRGMSVGGTVGVQLQPWSWGAASLSAEMRWAAADTLGNGETAPDTGGAMLSLTPSIMVQPVQDWLIRLSVQVHAGEWLDGKQDESTTVILSTVVDI